MARWYLESRQPLQVLGMTFLCLKLPPGHHLAQWTPGAQAALPSASSIEMAQAYETPQRLVDNIASL
eukprot:1404495-Pyramimonas_sp.AAC.2